jgi:hypothetical protein
LKLLTALFLGLLSLRSFAGDTNSLFEQLRNTAEKYEVAGTVCEQAARLDFEKKYPSPRYSVKTGIAYTRGHDTIGELDVVVFDTNNRSVVIVGEVKCWGDLSKAMKKASAQRERFLNVVKQNLNGIEMHDSEHHSVDPRQFRGLTDFVTISQKGGEAQGFILTLDFTLSELMSVGKRLAECQHSGNCDKPTVCRQIFK